MLQLYLVMCKSHPGDTSLEGMKIPGHHEEQLRLGPIQAWIPWDEHQEQQQHWSRST